MSSLILPGNDNAPSPLATKDVPPWRAQSSWAQVTSFFNYSCKGRHLEEPINHAAEIARKIEVVGELLENLCSITCHCCAEPCCQRATIWYDFTDLLFSYLQQKKLPPRQIVKRRGGPCPLLTPTGCSVPRLERPFICTWYVCPSQSAIINQTDPPAELLKVHTLLKEIQSARKLLEDSFVQAVVG